MLKILLSGCNGRMGQAITNLCREDENITIAAGLDQNAVKLSDYPVYADLMEYGGSADVLVDFSNASALEAVLAYGVANKTPLVLATTGYSDAQLKAVERASGEIPIFRSANMSLGVSLLADLVKKSAKLLGDTFDVEIVEKHHNQKVDAPSGTALMLYEAAKSALPYEPEPVYDRHAVRRKRSRNEIGLHAVRGGTIVGEHEVIFAGHHEVLELKHSALSREVFAAGALKAAQFIAGKQPGIYNMADVVAEIQ